MAYEVKGIGVISGSTQVHQFMDQGGSADHVRFNMNSGAGSFKVSGSAEYGRVVNTITDTQHVSGLLRIPIWHASNDATQLENLASSTLDDGYYNGCLFYLTGYNNVGYNGSDARTISLFRRGDCLYFCKNGSWHAGHSNPPLPITYNNRFLNFMDVQYLQQFELAGGWKHSLSISDLSNFSNYASPDNSDTQTFENGQGFSGTTSVANLDSFSNFSSPDNSDTLDTTGGADLSSFSAFADGHTTSFSETYEHGQGFLNTTSGTPTPNWDSGPDGNFTSTYEHGQGYSNTTSGTPSPNWDSSPDGDFTETYESW
jgi:hypothetical protein